MKFLSRVFDENLIDKETYYNYDFTWEMEGKMEFDFSLTDTEKVINLDSIDLIMLIIIETDSPIVVNISTDSESLDLEIDNTFIFTPTEDMQSNITSFSVKEEKLNIANTKVRVYGEVQES